MQTDHNSSPSDCHGLLATCPESLMHLNPVHAQCNCFCKSCSLQSYSFANKGFAATHVSRGVNQRAAAFEKPVLQSPDRLTSPCHHASLQSSIPPCNKCCRFANGGFATLASHVSGSWFTPRREMSIKSVMHLKPVL